jgi:hypothetical protein
MSSLMTTAHREETRTSVDKIAMELQTALGQRIVAYVTGNRSPKVVGRWARGDGKPQGDDAEQRLRQLYRTFLILRGTEDEGVIEESATIRNWLLGANPLLGDKPPLKILREGDPSVVQHAAEKFVCD